MCGLTGYLNFECVPETSNQRMLEMLKKIRHRGPNDSGIVAINTVNKSLAIVDAQKSVLFNEPAQLILGFNRLSIMDLSINGHQPMLSQDGQVALMLNGEIYNAFDFKSELEQSGYSFRGSSDTEVVLNLYLRYGFEKMIQKLNGMFAIVIYDQRIQKLYLARDRFGIKPLYLLQDKGRIAFASELKCFKDLPNFRFELNEAHLDEFLLFRNLINRTLFKNILNLTPGTFWEIEPSGDTKIHTFFTLLTSESAPMEVDALQSALRESLDRSVESQLMSDVKLGCQLSGGVDSSLVTYFAAQKIPATQLETVSIIFDQAAFSEERYIDQVANQLQLVAHKFTLDAKYYMEHLDKATWHFEQPLNHPNTIGIYLLSEQAKNHVTVLLSGEGADETFAGYSRFKFAIQTFWTNKVFLSKLKQNRKQLRQYLNLILDRDNQMIMGSVAGSFNTIKALKPDFNIDRALAFRRGIAQKLEGANLTRYRKYELLTYLPDLLMRQDKMSMAHAIENRVPFLDNKVVDLALLFPTQSLLHRHNGGPLATKYALKQLCADVFDENFAFRPKMGFGIPLKTFMSTSFFKEKLKYEILSNLKNRGLFNANALKRFDANIQTASPDQLEGLWLMTGFESWAQQYLDV